VDVQRALLFIALGFVLLLIYQRWLEESRPPAPVANSTTMATTTPAPDQTKTPEATPANTSPSSKTGGVPIPPSSSDTTGSVPTVPAAKPTDPTMPSGTRVVVNTDLLRVEIDTQGGGIRRAQLLKYPVSIDKPNEPVTLLDETAKDIYVTESGLTGQKGSFPTHETRYRSEKNQYQLADGEQDLKVKLFWDSPDGVRYTKLFTFSRNNYEIKVDFLIDNQSPQPWQGYMYVQFLRTPVVISRGFFLDVVPSFTGGAIYSKENKFEKIKFSDMAENDLQRDAESAWAAMMQHYFVSGWFPRNQDKIQLYTKAYKQYATPRYNIGFLDLSPVQVAPGAKGSIGAELYIGPKEQDRLKHKAEGFALTVDYGWLTVIATPLFVILRFIHNFVGNWGWAIILVTLLVKLAFYPLSAAQYKSMAKMKRLQPRLQTLKERYADDKTKFNQAMMELYKKEKVNPMGGCLPILIQIPVFIALYWVLLESVELRQASWALWIKDLSVKDPYFILPILMGGSMLAQHFLNPAPMDDMQRKIMMAMPIAFTFLFLYFPAGLVLYWLVNNVLSITQQWYITKSHADKTTG